jgi:hypothetical protein
MASGIVGLFWLARQHIVMLSVPAGTKSLAKDRHMKSSLKLCVAFAIAMGGAASAAQAGPCTSSIDVMQRKVDAAIDAQAGSGPWKTESASALRSRQPTPHSIAAAEGRHGVDYSYALEALNRARAADKAGDAAGCRRELANVRSFLGAGR